MKWHGKIVDAQTSGEKCHHGRKYSKLPFDPVLSHADLVTPYGGINLSQQ